MSSGLCIAILGPDGVGKSTLVAGLKDAYPRPITVLKMAAATRLPVPGPSAVRWLVRTALAAWVLSSARIDLVRGRVVVWDRHPLEDRAMRAEGRLVLGDRRRWLGRLAPQPDVVVILDAPTAVLRERRDEHHEEQLDRFRRIYERIAEERPAIVVEASRPAA
jgi:thymidylate kinase